MEVVQWKLVHVAAAMNETQSATQNAKSMGHGKQRGKKKGCWLQRKGMKKAYWGESRRTDGGTYGLGDDFNHIRRVHSMEDEKKEQMLNSVVLKLCIRNEILEDEKKEIEDDAKLWKGMYFALAENVKELKESNLDLSTVSERYSKLPSELGQACGEDAELREKVAEKVSDYEMLLKNWEE